MNRWSDNLDHTSHLSLTESTIMTGEPASAETRTVEARWRRSRKRGEEGGARRRSRPWCPSLCACPSSTPARPIIILCPPSVARVGIHLSAITGLDDNAAISGRPSFARPPSVRVRRFYCNENERGVCGPDDVRPDPIPFPPSPPGKRVLIWCPRPRRPCPSAGPVGPAKKFQKTNGTHHLNKWFFCLKLNRRNDRPRPNPTEENERGTQRSGGQTICIL